MSKELEALEKIMNNCCDNCANDICKNKENGDCCNFINYKIIETALKRLPELEKENVLLRQNNHSLEQLMKRPELEIARENIQLKRDNDLLLINECSARQENKELKEVLKIIKEIFCNNASGDIETGLCYGGSLGWIKLGRNHDYIVSGIPIEKINLLKEYLK
jgi:hypothetical protein